MHWTGTYYTHKKVSFISRKGLVINLNVTKDYFSKKTDLCRFVAASFGVTLALVWLDKSYNRQAK
jgi:hypothetical protein